MEAVKHKWLGTARIIRRDGNRITVKYDKNGSEVILKMPDSFMSGVFEIDEELKREVDAAVEAKKEASRIEREAREAQRASVNVASSSHRSGTRRSGRSYTKVQLTGNYEKDFETFMLKNGYSDKTENNTKSTVYSYINSVKSVMSDEGLDWPSMTKQISSIASVYDIGGAKAEMGDRGNRTVINALRRFEDFVNNSIPLNTTGNIDCGNSVP